MNINVHGKATWAILVNFITANALVIENMSVYIIKITDVFTQNSWIFLVIYFIFVDVNRRKLNIL